MSWTGAPNAGQQPQHAAQPEDQQRGARSTTPTSPRRSSPPGARSPTTSTIRRPRSRQTTPSHGDLTKQPTTPPRSSQPGTPNPTRDHQTWAAQRPTSQTVGAPNSPARHRPSTDLGRAGARPSQPVPRPGRATDQRRRRQAQGWGRTVRRAPTRPSGWGAQEAASRPAEVRAGPQSRTARRGEAPAWGAQQTGGQDEGWGTQDSRTAGWPGAELGRRANRSRRPGPSLGCAADRR